MSSASSLASCIYEGTVRHRRLGEGGRAFRYPLFMMYLDLDELDRVFAGRLLWSVDRPNVASLRRSDYLGDPTLSLREAVDAAVRERLGRGLRGPVRMLTHLRYFGYCLNPVTFYYCFEADGRELDVIVAEITNTPWGERRVHVLDPRADEGKGRVRRHRFAKDFHVSPFLAMDYEYDWRLAPPGASLSVHMENRRDGRAEFDATLLLGRREIGGASLARCLLRFPFMTLEVVLRIYLQALRLRLTGHTFFPHPDPTARIGG